MKLPVILYGKINAKFIQFNLLKLPPFQKTK